MEFVWFILIGLCAGWLAGQFMKGSGFGLVGNLIVGVIGALLGGFAFHLSCSRSFAWSNEGVGIGKLPRTPDDTQ
jgi:uncharacterized membrane protein YeaQ/YmgE (transglycosylase-associated protein family)